MKMPMHPQDYALNDLAVWLGSTANNLVSIDCSKVGSGQVADCYRIQLHWNHQGDLPATVVAKCPAKDPVSLETAKNFQLYLLEVNWYSQFAVSSGVRVPKPYYASINPDDLSQFILLLEDCYPAYQIDQYKGCSIEQVETILDEAAILHKYRWNDPILQTIPWLNKNKDNQGAIREIIPSFFKEFVERYKNRLDADILTLCQDLLARYDNYAQHPPTPFCLVHGDMRLDNILLGGDDGRAVLLDWQTISCGQPLADVAYCISTSFLDPQQRAQHEEQLVKNYVEKLQLSAAQLTFEQAWQNYRHFAFNGLVMAVISSMIVERTPRGDEMFAVMAERSGYQALHLDSLSLL